MNIKQLIRAGLIKKPKRPRRLRPVRPSRRAELQYKADLLAVVRAMRKAYEQYLQPVLKRTESQYARPSKDAALARDGYAADIMAAIDQMSRAMGGIDAMASRLAHTAVQRAGLETEVQLAQTLTNALGVDMAPTLQMVDVQPQIEAATIANTQLIKSLPDQFVAKLQPMILADVQVGRRYEDLADDIETLFGATENRAKVIARDQMAKVNSTINAAKQQAVGIEKYIWSTAGDERVRDSHAEKEGQEFAWDDPPADTGNPGEDIMCRCVAIPVIDYDDGEDGGDEEQQPEDDE